MLMPRGECFSLFEESELRTAPTLTSFTFVIFLLLPKESNLCFAQQLKKIESNLRRSHFNSNFLFFLTENLTIYLYLFEASLVIVS